jgi:hypothetical protein
VEVIQGRMDAENVCLPRILSVQVKRHAGTRGESRRGGRVFLCGGGWWRRARGSVRAARAAAGRSRFLDAAGGRVELLEITQSVQQVRLVPGTHRASARITRSAQDKSRGLTWRWSTAT